MSRVIGTVQYVRPQREEWILVLELSSGEPAVGDRLSVENGDIYEVTSLALGTTGSPQNRRTISVRAACSPKEPLGTGMKISQPAPAQ